MGYYVSTQSSTCFLPYENAQEAYDRMCKLNFNNSKKTGGSWPRPDNIPNDQPHEKIWYSWMPWNYHETCSTAKEILEELGFDMYEADNGIEISYYDSKTGAEDLFLEAIADLCSGEIEWRGEDNDMWKQVFTPGQPMKTLKGVVSYE